MRTILYCLSLLIMVSWACTRPKADPSTPPKLEKATVVPATPEVLLVWIMSDPPDGFSSELPSEPPDKSLWTSPVQTETVLLAQKDGVWRERHRLPGLWVAHEDRLAELRLMRRHEALPLFSDPTGLPAGIPPQCMKRPKETGPKLEINAQGLELAVFGEPKAIPLIAIPGTLSEEKFPALLSRFWWVRSSVGPYLFVSGQHYREECSGEGTLEHLYTVVDLRDYSEAGFFTNRGDQGILWASQSAEVAKVLDRMRKELQDLGQNPGISEKDLRLVEAIPFLASVPLATWKTRLVYTVAKDCRECELPRVTIEVDGLPEPLFPGVHEGLSIVTAKLNPHFRVGGFSNWKITPEELEKTLPKLPRSELPEPEVPRPGCRCGH